MDVDYNFKQETGIQLNCGGRRVRHYSMSILRKVVFYRHVRMSSLKDNLGEMMKSDAN